MIDPQIQDAIDYAAAGLMRPIRQLQGSPWHVIGDDGEPAFQNGWTNFDAGRVARFRREGRRCVLEGVVKDGATVPSVIFTLPDGFRPVGELNFPVVSNGAFGYVSVNQLGTVTVYVGSAAWLDLAPVAFAAA